MFQVFANLRSFLSLRNLWHELNEDILIIQSNPQLIMKYINLNYAQYSMHFNNHIMINQFFFIHKKIPNIVKVTTKVEYNLLNLKSWIYLL